MLPGIQPMLLIPPYHELARHHQATIDEALPRHQRHFVAHLLQLLFVQDHSSAAWTGNREVRSGRSISIRNSERCFCPMHWPASTRRQQGMGGEPLGRNGWCGPPLRTRPNRSGRVAGLCPVPGASTPWTTLGRITDQPFWNIRLAVQETPDVDVIFPFHVEY